MSLFGSVIGNLPLLYLPVAKLSKLSGQTHWDFVEQLQHQCIRLAWLQAIAGDRDVRQLLDLAVGLNFSAFSRARSQAPVEFFLELQMEDARRENEIRVCFGFFLEAEVNRLLREGAAGPVLQSLLPPEQCAIGAFACSALLENTLNRCREHVRTHALAFETVQIVQRLTGAPAWLEETPPSIAAYFELGEMMREAVGEEGAKRAYERSPAVIR